MYRQLGTDRHPRPNPASRPTTLVRSTSMHGYALFDTTLGRCAIAWGERGIACVELPGRDDDATVRRIRRALPDAAETTPPPDVAHAVEAIQRLLDGAP